MKRFIKLWIASFLMLSFLSLSSWAADHGSANEAKAMVQKSPGCNEKSGIGATVTEINKRDGQYMNRDLHVAVYDANGKNPARLNPKMVGK